MNLYIQTGQDTYSWTDDPEVDFQHVKKAIQQAKGEFKSKPNRMILLGFSQGGMVAAEMAARHPDLFSGAVTISAGCGPIQLDEIKNTNRIKNQAYVIVCGDRENPASVERSKTLESWFKNAGANVFKPKYPNHNSHDFPANAMWSMHNWFNYIKDKTKETETVK